MKPERLPELAEAYGLDGPITDVGPVSSRFDHILVFRIADRHLIAKPGNREWDEGHRFRSGIQQHLYDVGYPVPRVYRTLEGEYIWEPEGAGIVLTDFVGEAYDPSRKKLQCGASARALGWFHRVGPSASGIGTHYWNGDAGFEYVHELVQMSRDWLLDKDLTAGSQKRAMEVLDDLTATFEGIRANLDQEPYWELPHIPIHGEFSQYHCRYEGDEVAAVIDWDTVRLAPRLHDLSRAIDIGIGWGSSVEDPYTFSWHQTDVPSVDDIAEWMESYLELGPPLSQKEVKLLPYVCAAMWGVAGCPAVPRSDAEVENCERAADFMRLWLTEASAIQDALST